MKKLFILFLFVLFTTVLFAQLTVWPKNMLAELFTTSQCSSCPDAYAGLEVVHSNYDYSEFNSIRYYSSEGGGMYGSESVQIVFDNYGVTYTPQVFFNGTNSVPGGGTDVANGSEYLPIVSSQYFDASPIKLRILSFDPSSGDVSVEATLLNDDTDLTDAVIRFALVEDDVTELHTRIVRYITKSNFSMDYVGQISTFDKTLDIQPEYVQASLNVVSFVQLPDHTIIQSASTYQQPNTKVRAVVPFNHNTWDQNYDPNNSDYMYQGEYFSVVNTGNTEVTFEISVDYDDAPSDWYISFCDHSNCYIGPTQITLPASGENYHDFHVVLFPTSEGEATYHFTVSIPGTDVSYTIPFYYSTSASAHDNVIDAQNLAILYPAYPNPFLTGNNKTNAVKIRYSILHDNSYADLSIYNIKGQKVKTLVAKNVNSGIHNTVWNLTDKNGKKVSNGIYLYILDVDGKKLIKKLAVIK